ncbi:Gfo/Idh/MocA family protein [Streptomyces prasinopilosus]|uniref:Glucose-6-phosphate 3-dehydrogenase n=1 Tax=Streptomyces prasinopilosus TaxID=67344 RepID=A0A1G6M1V3_9ACTN|nr:Gfo/Idh/MocA family oxidoreductase [Streptomyces prasinopilosus]SDC49518.1 glucose-6-phosphate 3-dehydrogenase [Streptomyces prasinopilosus]
MRIGIMGAGNIAAVHLGAVRATVGAELVGLHDIAADRARTTAATFGCRAFSSPASLYRNVDAVVVASPNHTHHAIATDAVRLGKHVLCEKPMAVSTTEAAAMARAVRDTGLRCVVGFNYRFLDVAERMRQLISSEELGRPLMVEAAFRRGSALTRSTFTWRDSAQGRSTSGALGDLGVHLIDLLHFLFRAQVDTASCVTRLRTHIPEKEGRAVDVDDDAFVAGRLGSGMYFQLTASKATLPEETGLFLKVVCTRGEFVYHSREDRTLLVRPGTEWHRESLPPPGPTADPSGEVPGWADSFHRQLGEWVDVVVHGKESDRLADFEDGLRAQLVLARLLEVRAEGPV